MDVTKGAGRTDEADVALRSAARAWLDATDRLAAAVEDDAEPAKVLELADAATIARMRFHQTLADVGWTPPEPAR